MGGIEREWHRRRPRLAGGCWIFVAGARLGSGRMRQGARQYFVEWDWARGGSMFSRVVWRVVMSMHFLMSRIICLRFVLLRVDVTLTSF